jgi:hypothetical protein
MPTNEHAVGINDFLDDVVLQPEHNMRRGLDYVFILCRELVIGKFGLN